MTKPLTGQSSTIKRVNVALVKDALRLRGTATRRELAEATQLSQPTVNAIIRALCAENEVICRGAALSSGGRRAELYALNHESLCVAVVLALSDRLEFAVTDARCAILDHGRAPVVQMRPYPEQIFALAARLMEHYPNVRVAAVGIQSAVGVRGELFAAPQLPHLERTDLRRTLEKELPIPVVVENDVNMRALGYYRMELAGKTDAMAYLHLSTGLGAGVILGGRVHRGFSNFSGEVSFLSCGDAYPGGTLEETLVRTPDEGLRAQLLSRLAMSLICVLNPPFLVLGGSRITAQTVEQVNSLCLQQLPKGVAPHFLYAGDETRYLYSGLSYSAQELIDTELRLVRSGEA